MNSTLQTVLIVVAIAGLLAFRIYRQTQERRWSISGMWVTPAIFVVIAAIVIAIDAEQTPLAVATAVAGLAAGIGIGLYQGTHTKLRVDKADKAVHVRITPFGAMLFLFVLVLRVGIRYAMIGGATAHAIASGQAPAIPPGATMVSSALLALAVGSIVGLRWYIRRAYDAAPAA